MDRDEFETRLVDATTDLQKLREVERNRAALFVAGRDEVKPPVTYAEMARIAGISRAAVIQAIHRERARNATPAPAVVNGDDTE